MAPYQMCRLFSFPCVQSGLVRRIVHPRDGRDQSRVSRTWWLRLEECIGLAGLVKIIVQGHPSREHPVQRPCATPLDVARKFCVKI